MRTYKRLDPKQYRRVRHLAYHARTARVRKKNSKRLLHNRYRIPFGFCFNPSAGEDLHLIYEGYERPPRFEILYTGVLPYPREDYIPGCKPAFIL